MRRIWAVAKNLIREVLRMRILMVTLVLITLSYTVGFALWLYFGDGRVDEKVQTYLSYSLSISSVILGFLTIFISASSVSRDLKHREIYTVVTKPISRGGYLAGKALGMLLLNLVLTLINAGLIYGLSRGLAYFSDKDASEEFRLSEIVFISRQAVPAPIPDVSEAVRKKVEDILAERMQEEPAYRTDPVLVAQMRKSASRLVERQEIMKQRTISPGNHVVWHFSGLKPIDRENGVLIVRYKFDVSSSRADQRMIFGQWVYGAADPMTSGGAEYASRTAYGSPHEFGIPASELSPEGDLYVMFRNPFENEAASVIFPQEDGIEVLYVVGGFEMNFIRAIIMQYCRLIFLTVLGVAMGAWVSFPVAVLLMLVVYTVGLSSDFITTAVRDEAKEVQQEIAKWLLYILPRFSTYDPVTAIEKGRLVSWPLVSLNWLETVILKGGLTALFGYLVFRLRELARVIV